MLHSKVWVCVYLIWAIFITEAHSNKHILYQLAKSSIFLKLSFNHNGEYQKQYELFSSQLINFYITVSSLTCLSRIYKVLLLTGTIHFICFILKDFDRIIIYIHYFKNFVLCSWWFFTPHDKPLSVSRSAQSSQMRTLAWYLSPSYWNVV